jgi:D-3-phosphoglycerate dehydrogenase
VNAPALAAARGVVVELEAAEESVEYVSLIRLTGTVGDHEVALAGTVGGKGPMLVEILGHEAELPFSPHVVVIKNSDTPGMIGRVGTYLGEVGVNIANMVVGRSRVTGEAALMGLNLDQQLTPEQVDGLRSLEGIENARYLELG